MNLVIYVGLCLFCYRAAASLHSLTEHFFENLKQHPKLQLSEFDHSKTFVDRQVDNYVSLITKIGRKLDKNKRSVDEKLTKDSTGTLRLDSVNLWDGAKVPVTFPEDVALFEQGGDLFAVALDNASTTRGRGDILSIYRYNKTGKFFKLLDQSAVVEGITLATFALDNSTILIVVAENASSKIDFHRKSGVFTFANFTLERIQTLDMNYATDVALWRIHEDVYMSVAQYVKDGVDVVTQSPLYKWKGRHFDFVQFFDTEGASKMRNFRIGHSEFLAIANFRNRKGTKTFSVIYKFNHHIEKYEIYQKIATNGCKDIGFFSYDQARGRADSFLIVANHESESIVYKFVDDYFIPFHSFRVDEIEQWLPLVGSLHDNNNNKEVTLLAVTEFEGVRAFQYDGWSFVEVFPKGLKSLAKNPKSLRSFLTKNGTQLLVIADKADHGAVASSNIFTLNYVHENALQSIHDEVMTWCLRAAKNIRILDENQFLSSRSDISIEDDDSDVAMDEVLSKISELDARMSEIEQVALNSVKSKSSISRDLTADEVIFESDVTIQQNLEITEQLNNININEVLENSLNITKGFDFDEESPQIDFASIDLDKIPQKVNGRNSRDLIHLSDDLNLATLTVNGTIDIPTGFDLKGNMNGISLTESSDLIIDSDWSELENVKVERIFATNLNNLTLSDLDDVTTASIFVDSLKQLKVSKLTVGGYVNDVDIPTLDKFALKTSGDQIIEAKYMIDQLTAVNLTYSAGTVISNKSLSDLIRIDVGDYDLDSSFIFSENLTVVNLTVVNVLNDVRVDQDTGRLEVVFKHLTDDVQEVTGDKCFDSLEILNPINLNGKIKSPELEKINPVINISDDLVVEGDLVVNGLVKIEDYVKVGDVKTVRDRSIVKMRELGMDIDSSYVKPSLTFIQKLDLDDVNVNLDINGYRVDDFVITNGNDDQVLTGLKVFDDFVIINGSTEALKINHVNLEDFDSNWLSIGGNQVIEAKHTIKTVTIDRISSESVTKFGTHLWSDVRQNIAGTVIIRGDLTTKSVNAESITVNGTINRENFDSIINDTVKKSTSKVIRGNKTFTNLTVAHLSVNEDGFSLVRISDDGQIKLNGPLDIFEPIPIDNITFTGTCNNVKIDAFGLVEKDDSGYVIIRGSHAFDVITAQVGVELDRINHVTVNELVEDTVKIDEEFEFDSAEFESDVICAQPVELEGQIEFVDFNNTVLSFTDLEQVTYDEKTIDNLTVVGGRVYFDRLLSNTFNMSKLCQFSGENLEELTVDGDAYFVKGPNVANINSLDVGDILENGWFKNRDTILVGYSEFDRVAFEDDVSVTGFIDNVSLTALAANYFSKSRDQEVAAILTVDDVITFESDVSVPEILQDGGGDVNGINIEEFVGTALLDDYNQTFESLVFIENCNIKELEGEFLTNDMKLAEEVMRYDKVNMVTGAKIFSNVTIEHLRLDRNVKIHDVDILFFLQNVILTGGTYKIGGFKSLENGVFMDGLELDGSLNNFLLPTFNNENVLLRSSSQEITGSKVFAGSPVDPLTFKALKVKKGLNGIDATDLINDQVFKDKDANFLSRVNFNRNLTVKNLNLSEFRGINVTDLIRNVTNFGALNNLLGNYRDLLKVTEKLRKSLENQAYYLHNYKVIQEISQVENSVKIATIKGDRIANLKKIDGTNSTRIDFLSWHTILEEFHPEEYVLYPSGCISYFEQVLGRFLYIEQGDDNLGRFLPLEAAEVTTKIITNRTRFTTSFQLPEKRLFCTLFIYDDVSRAHPRIFCENNSYIELFQTIEVVGATKATSITMENTELYLALIVENGGTTRVCVYGYDGNDDRFLLTQQIYEPKLESVATVALNRHTNLMALASGHLANSMYSGRVSIWKFDSNSKEFEVSQVMALNSPIQVEFAVLPSGELVLYVLTDSATSPLVVYKYEGLGGFESEIVASSLGKLGYFYQMNGGDLLIGQSRGRVDVIRAVFKGERIIENDADEM